MPRLGFELTIPVFYLVKTLYALDRETNVIGGESFAFTLKRTM
jgi:hypothetical protein